MTVPAFDPSTSAGIIRLGNLFCDAQALLTAVRLGVFDVLRGGAELEEPQLRERLGLHGRGLRDFLSLLVVLGLLERHGPAYANTPAAQRFLVAGSTEHVGGFLLRSAVNRWPAWGRLGEALRTGEPQSGGEYHDMIQDEGRLRQFVGMMDGLTQVLGPELIKAFPWHEHATVLDVGGCRGNLLGQIVLAHPALRGTVFDLPPMEPLFAELAEERGISDRLSFSPGSFFTDPLPPAEVVVIGHVLHDWSRAEREQIFAKAFGAVRPGGALVVYDRMLEEVPTSAENLVISLDMLLVTPGGEEYPVSELTGYARQLGAVGTTSAALGDYDTVVICRKAT